MIQAIYIIWSTAQVFMLSPGSGLPNTLNFLHASQWKELYSKTYSINLLSTLNSRL